jgi:hypothetical protein
MGDKTKMIVKSTVIALFLFLSAFALLGTNAVTAAQDPVVPDAPTGLTAVSGINQVTLTWAAPVNNGGSPIDYYVVYQDGVALPDHPSGLTTTISVQYVYLSPMNFHLYSWTVAAHNAIGIGPQCDPATANPVNTPGAIESIRVSPEDGAVYIDIYRPGGRVDTGGLPLLYYIIYQDGVDVLHTTEVGPTISGLTNGQSYSFSAAMHNEVGDGPKTTPVTVIPFAVPYEPTDLLATPLNQAVNLTWSAPVMTGGGIDAYNVYLDDVLVSTTSKLFAVVGGLTNGHAYSFEVAAFNQAGQGPKVSVQSTPRPDSPDVPVGLTATPGNGQVLLSWTAPANNGGAPIDYYAIYQDNIDVVHATDVSSTLTGLTNGQSYTFTVAAHNSAGMGIMTGPVQTTPYTVPDAPTGVTAVPGNGQVTLNWTAPTFDGGSPVDYYVVYQDGTALPYHLTGPTTIIPGLVNGRTYSFTVAAHNLANNGVQSTAAVSTPVSAPDAPTGLTALPGHSQVSLNWTAPLSNGGLAIDYYVVYQNSVDVQHTTATSFISTGLAYGTTYNFTVSAHNLVGEGPRTVIVAAMPRPALTFPGIPTGLTATPGDGKVDLAWSLPVDNGGAPIDYYLVYQDDTVVANAAGSSWSITGLQNGQSYSFAIAAHNSIGISARSDVVPAIPHTIPGAPTGLTAIPGNGFVSLAWVAPGNNGGAAVDHYVVYQDGVALSIDPIGTSCVITGLTNGQSYNFTLAAHNPAGVGPNTYVLVVPTKTVPSEPTNASASTIDSGIVLQWSAPSDDGGYAITFSVFRGAVAGGESLLANLSGNSYVDTAVTLGTDYFYYVKAVNQLGSSIPSKEIGPIYASKTILLDMETESSSTIGALMTVTGTVKTAVGAIPIEGLSIDLSYSVNNGQTWIAMPSVNTSALGNFSSQWIPTATGIYMLKGTWAGNLVYQASTTMRSLAITSASDRYVFTVQSNSTISDMTFNSDSKKLSFNVSGVPGTNGYSRIVISKELVANGSEIKVSLDGADMSYQLSSTNTSWILYFEYHHSSHKVVASLVDSSKTGSNSNLSDSPLPIVAIAGFAVVAALLVAGLVLLNRHRGRN